MFRNGSIPQPDAMVAARAEDTLELVAGADEADRRPTPAPRRERVLALVAGALTAALTALAALFSMATLRPTAEPCAACVRLVSILCAHAPFLQLLINSADRLLSPQEAAAELDVCRRCAAAVAALRCRRRMAPS